MTGPHVRIDFKIDYKVLGETPEGMAVEFVMIPDPERYEWVKEGGKRYLFDKLDRIMFGDDVLADAAKQMRGLPIYYQPSEIKDAMAYAASRRPAIREALEVPTMGGEFADKSEAFLNALDKDDS